MLSEIGLMVGLSTSSGIAALLGTEIIAMSAQRRRHVLPLPQEVMHAGFPQKTLTLKDLLA
jgi:hypothetical protein